MEKEYLISSFNNNFEDSKTLKTAIYGISISTQIILDNCKNYNIVGLMDGYLKEGEIYGYPIISEKDILKLGVERIIIIARAASVKIILNRIKDFCVDNSISVYDVNGNDLLKKYQEFICDDCFEFKYEDLISAIDKCDVVSFDIFDTIVMRKTLFPEDVFEILQQKNQLDFSFFKERRKAEMDVLKDKYPSYYDIYDQLQRNLVLDTKTKEWLMEEEFLLEKENIILRKKVKDAFDYAVENGKRVFFVSDMYFSREQLMSILQEKGVKGYEDIIVSSEYGVMKHQGLFQVLLDRIGEKTCLHIGDNEYSDIDVANKLGIQTFHLLSAYQMLLRSSLNGIKKYEGNLQNRVVIGLIVSKIFNDPFSLYGLRGVPRLTSNFDFAYCFVSPIVTSYLFWLQEELKNADYDGVIFFARDGYLLQQIYKKLEVENKVPSIYYLISRFPAVLCNIHSQEDIEKVVEMGYDGSPQELLKNRFLLEDVEIQILNEGTDTKRYILEHSASILKRAEKMRESYAKYNEQLGVKSGKKYAVVDLAASGTCQVAFEKFTQSFCCGYYFVHIEDKSKKNLVKSLYKISTWFSKEAFICESYIILESILTSFEPSFKKFDIDGQPVFCEETRNDCQMSTLYELQKAIVEFFDDYIFLQCKKGPSPELGDLILSFMQKEKSDCSSLSIMKDKLVDEFFSRTYQFTDIIM